MNTCSLPHASFPIVKFNVASTHPVSGSFHHNQSLLWLITSLCSATADSTFQQQFWQFNYTFCVVILCIFHMYKWFIPFIKSDNIVVLILFSVYIALRLYKWTPVWHRSKALEFKPKVASSNLGTHIHDFPSHFTHPGMAVNISRSNIFLTLQQKLCDILYNFLDNQVNIWIWFVAECMYYLITKTLSPYIFKYLYIKLNKIDL